MSVPLVALASAVLTFAILKALFALLAWLFPEADSAYRKQLDALFDVLDSHSLHHLGQETLLRLLRPVNNFFTESNRGYAVVASISLLQNAIVFTVVTTLAIASHWGHFSSGLEATLESVQRAGWLSFLAVNALVAILGTLFDLLSLKATLILVNAATTTKSGMRLSAHLAVDLAIAIVSCMWAYFMLDLTLRTFYTQILPQVRTYAFIFADQFIRPTLWDTLAVNSAIWYVVIGLGASAALPTLVYVVALTPVLFLRLAPRRLQAGLARVTYLLTTDKDPVLKQFAAFTTHSGALIAALISWIKFTPS